MSDAFKLAPQRAASKAAQARGDDGEDLVEGLHRSLAFQRTYPGTWFVRRYAKRILVAGELRSVKPQGPDFGGGVVVRGCTRPVGAELEVKAVDPEAAPRLVFARFTGAEYALLSACASAGGIACVLVLYGSHLGTARWCSIPWTDLQGDVAAWTEDREGARASWPAEEILSYAVKSPVDYLRPFVEGTY